MRPAPFSSRSARTSTRISSRWENTRSGSELSFDGEFDFGLALILDALERMAT